ncbi:hypothetical protein BDA96_01G285200 [Sorghum bicolor]|uniref:Uncharacterized protein n=1 Tax=Sorghum bicolor TaxID=4558 RepID=A0A921S0A0_SORBI|nr:hypothetical protein BDA96_01G285200 [Sorghum bicolor]
MIAGVRLQRQAQGRGAASKRNLRYHVGQAKSQYGDYAASLPCSSSPYLADAELDHRLPSVQLLEWPEPQALN